MFAWHLLLCTFYTFQFYFLHIMHMCVCGFIYLFIDLHFFHISLCLCSSSFNFSFEHFFFPQVTGMLSIASPITLPFQKVCANFHVVDITISLTCGVYCNAYRSKSMIQKLGFFPGSIVTNDELVLLTIEGKWLETIVHMTKSKFLDITCPK